MPRTKNRSGMRTFFAKKQRGRAMRSLSGQNDLLGSAIATATLARSTATAATAAAATVARGTRSTRTALARSAVRRVFAIEVLVFALFATLFLEVVEILAALNGDGACVRRWLTVRAFGTRLVIARGRRIARLGQAQLLALLA